MPIPPSKRVIYKKAALDNVICQLRFPPVLRIGSEPPVKFQDSIRKQFPHYEERVRSLKAQLPPEIASVLPAVPGEGAPRAHDFLSGDRTWQVSLTRDFLALTTSAYTQWEDFKQQLDAPMAALQECYEPSFYVRIGLRYRDVVVRSKLGLRERPWSTLLRPHIAGELAESARIQDEVVEAKRELLIRLQKDTDVKLRHGLALIEGTDEHCYVIDADYFTNTQTETRNATQVLNELNSYAGRLFRWCITDELHNAMVPQPVE